MRAKDRLRMLEETCEGAIYPTGMEEAIIGVAERTGQEDVALLDKVKCLKILMKQNGWTEDEAEEWFYFNTIGAWMGDKTPVFVTLFEE